MNPSTESVLGECLAGQGRFDEAEPLVVGAYEILRDHPKAPETRKRAGLERVVELYLAWGWPDRASEWQEFSTQWKQGSVIAGRDRNTRNEPVQQS